MTEDEAKTKWCPQTGVSAQPIGFGGRLEWNRSPRDVSLPVGENSSTAVHSMSRCIGSACMAWRSGPAESRVLNIVEHTLNGGGERLFAAGYTLDAAKHYWRKPLPPSGYCGLAGRPHG